MSVGIEQSNLIEQYATEKWYELDEATRMRVTATQSPADAQTNFLLRNADGKHELIVRSREAMQGAMTDTQRERQDYAESKRSLKSVQGRAECVVLDSKGEPTW